MRQGVGIVLGVILAWAAIFALFGLVAAVILFFTGGNA